MWNPLPALFRRPTKEPLGRRGETLAAKHLRSLGFKILQRNFLTPLGEIDIIARHANTIVFVEVKTREHDDPTPEDQVNQHKQHQLTRVAKFYLRRYSVPPPARFDVVAVVWPPNSQPVIRHIPNAFQATF